MNLRNFKFHPKSSDHLSNRVWLVFYFLLSSFIINTGANAQTANGSNPVVTILNSSLSSPTEPVTVVINYCPTAYTDTYMAMVVNNTATEQSVRLVKF